MFDVLRLNFFILKEIISSNEQLLKVMAKICLLNRVFHNKITFTF